MDSDLGMFFGDVSSDVRKLHLFDFDDTIAFTSDDQFDEDALISPVENTEITDKLKELLDSGEDVAVLSSRENADLIRNFLYSVDIFYDDLNIYALGDPDEAAKGNYILDNFDMYDVVILYDNNADYLKSAAEILEDSEIEFIPELVVDHRKVKASSEVIAYHGSYEKFDSFKQISKAGVNTFETLQPLFFSRDFDYVLSNYAYAKGGYVYKVKLQPKKLFTLDAELAIDSHRTGWWDRLTPLGQSLMSYLESSVPEDEVPEDIFTAVEKRPYDLMESVLIVTWLEQEGYDSFEVKEYGAVNIAVLDPSIITILDVYSNETKNSNSKVSASGKRVVAAESWAIPPQLKDFYQVSDISNAPQWKAEVLVGNSGNTPIGTFEGINYVLIDLDSNYIIPVAESDEHQRGLDILDYLHQTYNLPPGRYASIAITMSNYLQNRNEESRALTIEAIKKWVGYGGSKVTVQDRTRNGSVMIDGETLVETGTIEPFVGSLSPSGKYIVDSFQYMSDLLNKILQADRKEPLIKKLNASALKLLQFLNDNYTMELITLKKQIEQGINDLMGSSDEDYSTAERVIFSHNGVKNSLHNKLRSFEKDPKDYDVEHYQLVFGDVAVAKQAFDAIDPGIGVVSAATKDERTLTVGDVTNYGVIEDETDTQFLIDGNWVLKSLVNAPDLPTIEELNMNKLPSSIPDDLVQKTFKDIVDFKLPLDSYGNITLYHGTDSRSAKSIKKSGLNPWSYLSSSPDVAGRFGSTVIKVISNPSLFFSEGDSIAVSSPALTLRNMDKLFPRGDVFMPVSASSKDVLRFFEATASGIYGLILVPPLEVAEWVEGVKGKHFKEGLLWLLQKYPGKDITLEVATYLRKLYTKITGENIRDTKLTWEYSGCRSLVEEAGKNYVGPQESFYGKDKTSVVASGGSSDEGYLTAVESGDLEKASQMVKQSAEKAGYSVGPVYHGTNNDFTEFKAFIGSSLWFSSDRAEIERGESGAQGTSKIMTLFLKANNPAGWKEYEKLVTDQILSRGFDSLHLDNTWVVFSPEQVKSADPVVYDDSGNVIPLSDRFNSSSKDIRAALSIDDSISISSIPDTSKALSFFFSATDSFYDLYPGYSEPIDEEEECMFESAEVAEGIVEDVLGVFEALPDPIPVYRAIYAKTVEDIDLNLPGQSWSFVRSSALTFGRNNGSNFLLSAFVPKSAIDWDYSVKNFAVFSLDGGDFSEDEVVVADESAIKDIKVYNIKDMRLVACIKNIRASVIGKVVRAGFNMYNHYDTAVKVLDDNLIEEGNDALYPTERDKEDGEDYLYRFYSKEEMDEYIWDALQELEALGDRITIYRALNAPDLDKMERVLPHNAEWESWSSSEDIASLFGVPSPTSWLLEGEVPADAVDWGLAVNRRLIFPEENEVPVRDPNKIKIQKITNLGTGEEITEIPQHLVRAMTQKASKKVTATPADAWHGSPYEFDKFSLENVGTGEGNQSFGWGLYFTSKEEIADFYRNELTSGVRGKALINGEPVENTQLERYLMFGVKNGAVLPNALELALKMGQIDLESQQISKVPGVNETSLLVDQISGWLDSGAEFTLADSGVKYKVTLWKNKQETLLDWNKSLEEQDPLIKDIASEFFGITDNVGPNEKQKKLIEENKVSKEDLNLLFPKNSLSGTGQQFYDEVSNVKGSDKAASEFLLSKGVDGIKYLADGSSGGSSGDAYNYVVFNDKDVTVEKVIQGKNVEASEVDDQATRIKAKKAADALSDLISITYTDGFRDVAIREQYGKFSFSFLSDEFDPEFPPYMVKVSQADNDNANFAPGGSLHTINLFVKSDTEDVEEFIDLFRDFSPRLYDNFIHEHIHLSDYIRSGGQALPSSPENKEEYYNSPMEYNAYYQQAITRMENTLLNRVDRKDILSSFDTFYSFAEPYFQSMFLESMNTDTEKKFMKRIYRFFAENNKDTLADAFYPKASIDNSLDNEYLTAVESGDLEKAQNLVNEAAKRAGYLIGPVYPGSPDARFLKDDPVFKSHEDRLFDTGKAGVHWFSKDRSTASSYADDRRAFDYQNAEPGIVTAFIKLENPLKVNGKGEGWRDVQKRGKTSNVIEEAQSGGHDGVIIENVKDLYNGNKSSNSTTTTYAVFSSNQIKLADSVTYDDSGEIIPLSKRFDSSSKDIRAKKVVAAEVDPDVYSYLEVYSKDKTDLEEVGDLWGVEVDLSQPPDVFWKEMYQEFAEAFNVISQRLTEWSDGLSPDNRRIAFEHMMDMSIYDVFGYFLEEYGWDDFYDYDSLIDDAFFQQYFDKWCEDYYIFFEFGSHGFVCKDGSSIDVPGDDHRIIPIEQWFPEDIITVGITNSNGSALTARLNTTSNSSQFKALDQILLDHSVTELYYDVYQGDNLVNSGSVTDFYDFDWRDLIRNVKGSASSVMPESLKGLASIAAKSDSFSNFVDEVTQSHGVDLSNRDLHRFGRGMGIFQEDEFVTLANISIEFPSYLDVIASSDRDLFRIIESDSDLVTIYRAVPASVDTIEFGDYVTLDESYAEMHLESVLESQQGVPGKIISKDVPKKDVKWNMEDMKEWVYSPSDITGQFKSLEAFYFFVKDGPNVVASLSSSLPLLSRFPEVPESAMPGADSFVVENSPEGFSLDMYKYIPLKLLVPMEPLAEKDMDKVESIKARLMEGADMPPLIVTHPSLTPEESKTFCIHDGHHRYLAYRDLGEISVPCAIVSPETVFDVTAAGSAFSIGGGRYGGKIAHTSPNTPGKVQVTNFDVKGEPAGHVLFDSFAEALADNFADLNNDISGWAKKWDYIRPWEQVAFNDANDFLELTHKRYAYTSPLRPLNGVSVDGITMTDDTGRIGVLFRDEPLPNSSIFNLTLIPVTIPAKLAFCEGLVEAEGIDVTAALEVDPVEDVEEDIEYVNSIEWFHGNRGSEDPLAEAPVYLSSSRVVAELFAGAGKYVLEVNGEPAENISYQEATLFSDAVNANAYTPDDIVNWGTNLFNLEDPEINRYLNEALATLGYSDVKSVRLLKKDEGVAGVFSGRISLDSLKVVDYKGSTWGTSGAFLDKDAMNAKNAGYPAFLGKNVREGGVLFDEDFPMADTLVVFDLSIVSGFNKLG